MRSPVLTREAVYGALAAEQYGLVTSRQLASLGLSRSAVSRRIKAGVLIPVLPGVWRLCGVPRSWHQRAMAVFLWAGENSAIAGLAAAALHQLDGIAMPSQIQVVTLRRIKAPSRLVVARHPLAFPDEDRTSIARIGVTTCARTLIDVAASVSEAQLELAIEDARRRRLVSMEEFTERIEKLPSNQPGLRKLSKVFAAVTGTKPSESNLEVKVIRMLRAAGFPAPIRQEALTDDGRFAGRVDLAYPERRLVIEVQSHRWHDGRDPLDADSARHNQHHAMGWLVMKATSKMLRGEARTTFLRDLRRAYERALA
ncbi:MAG: type IV toxin-antitoxin system AbiEi family antitoxin domain-containing protein [Actinomycetota bacterium]